ncbi:MAG: carotenoid biosynthesis protein [Clostridiales bacterium]|jgi:uncharacterized membrane protein|nr:carotenoid biosynthesis protein [Clostridiales bacterium]
MSAFLEFLKSLYSAFDTSKMEWFTFEPTWVLMDIVVLLLGVYTVGFILKHEEHPKQILLEILCFIFLFAGVYENMASVMGWYGFGKSIVMIFNVPITVPLIEALFTYASIRFLKQLKIPNWAVVCMCGIFGVLADLTLDPLALAQERGGIGRWSWYIENGDVNFFGAPVYNFSGWFLICGIGSLFILLGRHWHKKSGYNKTVGLIYPPLCFLGALTVMVSPISQFLLWLGPWGQRGSLSEYPMFIAMFVLYAVILIIWRGRMRSTWDVKTPAAFPVIFGLFYLTNIVFDCLEGRFDILLFSLPFIALHAAVYAWAVLGRKRVAS